MSVVFFAVDAAPLFVPEPIVRCPTALPSTDSIAPIS
jgi:hypothetical protein